MTLEELFGQLSKINKTAEGLERILLQTKTDDFKTVFKEHTGIELTKDELKTLTGDLLLIEGKYTEQQIVDHLFEKGCKRISFIGDINYAQTNTDRYLGFLESLKKHNFPLIEDLCFTDSIGIGHYGDCIFNFLDSLDPDVDAIVCVSDYVAHYVEMYLEENPHHFHNDILLTGFDCSKEYTNVINRVTTVNVKNNLLGKRLAMQIEFRMNYPAGL